MDPIKLGSKGPEVREVQLLLKAVGYDVGDVDGFFGKVTLAALLEFQEDVESLDQSGIVDDETMVALKQAAVVIDEPTEPPSEPGAVVPCDDETWAAFQGLVEVVTAPANPVRYGPGRGLCRDGKWIVTFGPGDVGKKQFATHRDKTYPSFHCSSWTNFFLGWLLRYNADYTHAGNIPSLFDLVTGTPDLHKQSNASSWRGYGPHCREIASDGTTFKRSGQRKCMDLREIFARREELPTFLVCGQSTRKSGKWKWWHHTVLYVIDHRTPGAPLHRIAADGFKDKQGYSGKAMQLAPITEKALTAFDNVIYRPFGVLTTDGSYGPADRPRLPVVLET
jgi:hypothetical protein